MASSMLSANWGSFAPVSECQALTRRIAFLPALSNGSTETSTRIFDGNGPSPHSPMARIADSSRTIFPDEACTTRRAWGQIVAGE